MATPYPADSVGLVSPQSVTFNTPLELDGGHTLESFELAYETYGTLNADASNAVLVCHALSGPHHAAGYHADDDRKPGWWEACIGPDKPLDTKRFFVVCSNNLGGCHGSTGPTSLNSATGQPYGADFPLVTVRDWVRSQALLADHLGIQRWAAVAGGSLGGMQALQWAIDLPDRVANVVAIAAAPRLSAQNIAFNEVARQAIRSDPEFHEGRYQQAGDRPRRGLMLARMLGHITYLSEAAMREKFGRDQRGANGDYGYNFDVEFEVESYLRYQGQSFVDRFDANTYLLMTKALDYFDPAAEYGGDLGQALAHTRSRYFIASFTSDWRFPPSASREIVRALLDTNKSISYAEIEADHGHDAFLMPVPQYLDSFTAFMRGIDLGAAA